ncbi:large ribosomal subunit protein mL62 [Pseudophryne corroboree]|uniref:large ribosomal subunit protein mL62 n=1 Tax=Pseudophryne corroboree TaxID=495146 RepID=UPI003081E171
MAVIGLLSRAAALRAFTSFGTRSQFRSAYSLDKLYPDSLCRTAEEKIEDHKDIPIDRLSISYSRSSGPGGQNVNKVNTKAEVRFHLSSADWIPEDVRQNISVQYKNRITRSGELIVVSQVSRYQMRNLADCLDKIQNMISEASQKPKPETEDDLKVRQIRFEAMNHERLRQKKIHSSIKQSRHISLD